jgi:hypothetical protein
VFAAAGYRLLCCLENVVEEKSYLLLVYVVVCNAVIVSLRTSGCSARFTQNKDDYVSTTEHHDSSNISASYNIS